MYKMKSLKFIHITKCAGSFIEDIGIKNRIRWGKYHREYGFWHEIFINKPLKLKMKYDWFVIVRNPYDRILSEYYCKWAGIGKKSHKEKSLWELFFETNYVHNKEQFNKFLINKIKHRKGRGDHYTEQYKYIDNNCNITIIKFENLNQELSVLFNKYLINIDIYKYPKINSSTINDKLFTIDDFNDELIKCINDVYHKDFIMFNYTKKFI